MLVENVENPWLDTTNGLAPVYEKFSLNTDYSYRVCDNNGYAPAYCLDKSLAVTHAGKFRPFVAHTIDEDAASMAVAQVSVDDTLYVHVLKIDRSDSADTSFLELQGRAIELDGR